MTNPSNVMQITNNLVEGAIAPQDYPTPVGYRLLVEPIEVEETTAGGLLLPSQSVEAKEHLRAVGRVISMGPLCYQHAKFRADLDDPRKPPASWCKVGDWITYNTYAGHEIKVRRADGKGHKAVRFINDDEVLGTVADPRTVLNYV